MTHVHGARQRRYEPDSRPQSQSVQPRAPSSRRGASGMGSATGSTYRADRSPV